MEREEVKICLQGIQLIKMFDTKQVSVNLQVYG